MIQGRNVVRNDQIARGGFQFTSSGVWVWHDGIKNLRHFVGMAQGDWAKEDASGTSGLSFPFDSGSGRIPARINPSATGTHKIRRRIQLPRDFGVFAPFDPISVVTQRSDTVTSIKATLWKGPTADAGVNGVDVSPIVSLSWETFILTPTGSYNPGDFVTFEIEYVSDTIGHLVDVADVYFAYKTNRGNV